MLKVANPLLWLGLLSEGLVLAALLWIPPLARVFALVPSAGGVPPSGVSPWDQHRRSRC